MADNKDNGMVLALNYMLLIGGFDKCTLSSTVDLKTIMEKCQKRMGGEEWTGYSEYRQYSGSFLKEQGQCKEGKADQESFFLIKIH